MATMETPHPRRIIEVNGQIIGPVAPRAKTVRPRKLSDYPHVAAVYLDVARRLASPLRMGPPICDELMAVVQHLFTEEEAGVVRHLGLYRGRAPRRWPGPNTVRWSRSSRFCAAWPTRSA